MKWLDTMNRAMNYIESTLEEKTDYEKIAQIACCSTYHFQRMFTFMTDVTLSEYIRRRRMTLAAFELQSGDIKVIDLALKFGYDSPEAFTRAFQNLHGLTPTAARCPGASVKAFPRIFFQITVKGVSEMNYKIVEKEAFQVYGIEEIFDSQGGENLKAIPEFWTEKLSSGEADKLARSGGFPGTINAICGYREIGGTSFPYMLCAIKTPLSDTSGYTVVDVPKATWAVFANEPHGIEETTIEVQALNSRVYTEWLPTASYDLVGGFEFELYYCNIHDDKCYEEVWVRVVPQK